MIKKIIIEIDGNEIELSKEQAIKLRNDLNEITNHSTIQFVPYEPYVQPNYPLYPQF